MIHRFTKSSLVVTVMALLVAASMTGASAAPGPRHATSGIDWLSVINYHRAQAGLPPMSENHGFSDDALKHSVYTVKTGDFGHGESSSSPYYTPEGDRASNNSILNQGELNDSERDLISRFMKTPVHGLYLLDAQRAAAGYGFYREDANSGTDAATSIYTGGAATFATPADFYPVAWPGNGTSVPFTEQGAENPDPRTDCGSGNDFDTGLPVSFQFATSPQVTAHSFSRDGVQLPHCMLDADTKNTFLRAHDAALIIPNAPLEEGATYSASVTVGGEVTSTTFTVTPFPMIACSLKIPAGVEYTGPWANFRDNSYAPVKNPPESYERFNLFTFGGNDYSDVIDIQTGPDGTYNAVTTKSFDDPGIYTVEYEMFDPYYETRIARGTIEVLPAGSAMPTQQSCVAPALPPEPPMPPMRPTPPIEEGSGGSGGGGGGGGSGGVGGTLYVRDVSLRLRGHLAAVGSVTMDPWMPECLVAQTVDIEKIRNGDWTRVKSVVTTIDGTFKVRLRDKPGKYRAWMDPVTVDDGQCISAYSRTRRHVH